MTHHLSISRALRTSVALAAIAGMAAPGPAFAQAPLLPDATLAGDDPDGTLTAFGDAFAASGDSWGDWLFLGAPRETAERDGAEFRDGAVYIYKRGEDGDYAFVQKLTMPGSAPAGGDAFGAGVDAASGWLFIAAANDVDFDGQTDPNNQAFRFAGQVHVYELVGSSWEFSQTLISPTPKGFGAFGARTQSSNIALRDDAKIAVIGEANNFPGATGQLHSYRLDDELGWVYVQTLDAPLGVANERFGDDLVFLDRKYLLAGGLNPVSAMEGQGYVSVFQAKGASGQFFATPNQIVYGEVFNPSTCPIGPDYLFGSTGFDSRGGTTVVAEPCASGSSGPFVGKLSIFGTANGSSPLQLETEIYGDDPGSFLGGNIFSSVASVSVSESGDRFLAGSPLADGMPPVPDGGPVYLFGDGPGGWELETTLTTDTPAVGAFRGYGDTVLFVGDDTAVVRENNYLQPIETGLKGRALIYDLDD